MNEKTEDQRLVIKIISKEEYEILIKRLIEAVKALNNDGHSYLAKFVLEVVIMLLEGKKE